MVNPERGAVELRSEDGTRVYRFRLSLAALAQLQQRLSTPDRLVPLAEVGRIVDSVMDGKNQDLSLAFTIYLVGFQQFHGNEIKTHYDVEAVIADCGGLAGILKQVSALGVVAESLKPDPEDAARRAANPRKARPRKT